jgi:hypothetical protein
MSDFETTVLVIEPKPDTRERIASWLEAGGYDVLECPGPSAPDFTCVGSRGGVCPLVETADVVVLDLSLASDRALQGTPGWELLFYYYEHNKRIVVLSGRHDPLVPLPEDRIAVIPRGSSHDTLVATVGALARPIERNRHGHDPAG